MSKYCTSCGNEILSEEKFCKHCGNKFCEEPEMTKISEFDKESSNSEAENTYEFIVDKLTFRFMSTKINTTVTVKNNILSTHTKCKSKMLSKKYLNKQIKISDISSVEYKQYATVALLDVFVFVVALFAAVIEPSYLIAYALIAGALLWRTLVPSLEIKTKDNGRLNILFSPQDNGKTMLKLISQISGKEVDENSEIKIPFSKKPFVVTLVYAIVAFVLVVIFA